ncbi:880_t:CDS:2 [Funneliformis geosporum]|uniref:880_t:CDS:1 n=1 Tax=Funneliformis geosporum TaxID=1117311 RepID=A0A9W4WQ94_9GLOM|nr:880_t:CDS:2 [Funneliformis geosporum]
MTLKTSSTSSLTISSNTSQVSVINPEFPECSELYYFTQDDSRFPDVRPKIESIRTLTTVTVYYYAFDIKDVRRSSSSYANILYKLPTLLREFK